MLDYVVDHIHLNSPEPLKTAEFYEQTLGAKRVAVRELGNGRIIVNVSLNGTTILISHPRTESTPAGLNHFGVSTADIEKAAAELKSRGVKFTHDIKEVLPGLKIAFFLSPDNITIELQEGKSDDVL